ncbi:YIP1 family protein [Natronospora cellulosivora (SeqCode)]
MKKTSKIFYMLLLLFILSSGVIYADSSTYAVPYYSYTYDFWQDPIMAPQAYQAHRIINGEDLGVGAFSNPQDLFVWNNQEIYIADTGNNRIIITDSEWNLIKIIEDFENDGELDTFNQPYGLYVTNNDELFVADRRNNRLVVLDRQGELIRIISSPVADNPTLFRSGYQFLPVKVAVDNVGRTYVIAEEIIDGVMEFDLDGDFRGFLGAPRISPDFIDYLWRRISPQARQERLSLLLPTEYSNLDVDERGFIFTTVGTGEYQDDDAIRRLNPSGKDVLKRQGFAPPTGDYGSSLQDAEGEWVLEGSHFRDILAREEGIYSALDQERGRVFTYDYFGNLLYVFAGRGFERGNLRRPRALAEFDSHIMVIDSELNDITVYAPTRYQKLIHDAIREYNSGQYQESANIWSEVVGMNANFDLGYTGIGRAYFRDDNFAEAMQFYRLGQNREGYSAAYEYYRKDYIRDNINMLFLSFIIIIFLIILIRKYSKVLSKNLYPFLLNGLAKSETAAISYFKEDKWRFGSWIKARLAILYLQSIRTIKGVAYARHVVFHPFDGFWDLKHEKLGNLPAATVILILFTLSNIIQRQYTGFIFNQSNLARLNVLAEFAFVLIPFFLWVTVNWSFTTLMNGKGKFKDIYIATAYAFTPMIIINIPVTIISNFITMEEGAFIFIFSSIAVLWSLLLLFFGTMTTHQYETGKNFFLTILIIAGIIFSLFIGILFFNLSEQVIQFIRDIYTELFIRA